MAEKKKQKGENQTSTSAELMSVVANTLFKSMQDTDLKDLEIFEQYSNALQKKLFHNEEEFLSRFQEGYKALLAELKENKN